MKEKQRELEHIFVLLVMALFLVDTAHWELYNGFAQLTGCEQNSVINVSMLNISTVALGSCNVFKAMSH